jgi:hypothetical protein
MSNRFSDYDAFARAYNRHWGPRAGDTQLPILHDLLLPGSPPTQPISTCVAVAGISPTCSPWRVTRQRAWTVPKNCSTSPAETHPLAAFVLADVRSFILPALPPCVSVRFCNGINRWWTWRICLKGGKQVGKQSRMPGSGEGQADKARPDRKSTAGDDIRSAVEDGRQAC